MALYNWHKTIIYLWIIQTLYLPVTLHKWYYHAWWHDAMTYVLCWFYARIIWWVKSWSGQYSPVLDSKTWKMRIDGEFWSWHESSQTIIDLNQDISPEWNLLILTRHPRWSEGYEAVVTQSAKIETKNKIFIAPDEELLWGITNTNPGYMKHNFEVGQRAAKKYLEDLRR